MKTVGQNSTSKLLLIGDGFSAFGTWIDFIAILTLSAYQYHVSSIEMAVVSAAMLLPGILLAPVIGRICDQRDPKQILLLSIIFRVLCTAGVLLLQNFGAFLILISLRSIFASVAPPAINVMAIRSLNQTALPKFYSVLNILNSAAKIIAPALGTISSSLSSEAFALIMSAVFSSASFAAFSMVRTQSVSRQDEQRHSTTKETSITTMMPFLWIAGSYAFFVFMVNNLVPVALERSGFDKSLLGILISCSGAGNILSGIWLAKKSATGISSSLSGRPSETLTPALLQALGFAVIALLLWSEINHKAYILPVVFFFIGTVSARYAIALNIHMSTHHGHSIGAASGALQSAQNIMILLAPMLGAIVLDKAGAAGLFATAAATAFLLYALFIAMQALGMLKFQHSKA
ncbi:MFS transporter [Iodobacter fluviatilis]|uniref:Arabinose efflux permease n=1 Tax=Iodobacter fluviatilis TaxID=537 RepID=A0A377SUV6_9NEIS|nr:MFS transporter [Iodobacter fluviatilis]TCU81627.1 putative MFS family arabinose efflux permease [Iodobacter fluviatilis]STR44773.1 Arabinose efflux permease [Iodobacter fluviatilis]